MNRKHSYILIVALILLPSFSGTYAQQDRREDQKPDDKVRLATNLVSTTVLVTDTQGRMVTGLEKENFEIYDDGVRQEIAFFSNEDAPITLGIVFDISGSMSNLTSKSVQTLRRFFETSHTDDEYFIIAFNSKPNLVQDFTVSPGEILDRVIFVKAGGNTALFDATYLAVEKVRQGQHKRKALLVLSDGMENNSRYSGQELGTLLKESDAPIFTIGIGREMEGANTLRMLAGLTGGKAFFPLDDNEVGNLYVRIALMLRHQYVLGFYPTDTSDGARMHQLRVKMKTPRQLGRLSLHYKKGYESFR